MYFTYKLRKNYAFYFLNFSTKIIGDYITTDGNFNEVITDGNINEPKATTNEGLQMEMEVTSGQIIRVCPVTTEEGM